MLSITEIPLHAAFPIVYSIDNRPLVGVHFFARSPAVRLLALGEKRGVTSNPHCPVSPLTVKPRSPPFYPLCLAQLHFGRRSRLPEANTTTTDLWFRSYRYFRWTVPDYVLSCLSSPVWALWQNQPHGPPMPQRKTSEAGHITTSSGRWLQDSATLKVLSKY